MKRTTAIILVVLVLAAFFVRNWNIRERNIFSYDEIIYSTLAVQIAKNPADYNTMGLYAEAKQNGRDLPAYLNRPLFKHPPLFISLITAGYSVLGTTYRSAIMISLFFGILLILTAYFLGKLLFGWKEGIYAACIMSIEPVIWVCSERVWMGTALAFFTVLSVYLFFRAVKKYNALTMIASGIAAGSACLVKYPGVLAVAVIIVYALCFERRLFRKKSFIAALGIPFIMLLPWFFWNYKVYGADLFSINEEIIQAAYGAVSFLRGVLIIILPIVLISWFIARMVRKYRGFCVKYLLPAARAAGWTALVVLFCAFIFVLRRHILNAGIIFHVPSAGWEMGMFRAEAWYFYFGRLMELSPFYVFAFLGFFLMFIDRKFFREYFFLSLFAAIILAVFIVWKNYQSRYIASAVVPLIVLSARTQIYLAGKANSIKGEGKRRAVCGILLFLVLYAILKTLCVDIVLTAPDVTCYF